MNDIQLYGYNGANHLLSNDRGINEESSEISCTMAENANGRCVYYNAADENLIYMAKQNKRCIDYGTSWSFAGFYKNQLSEENDAYSTGVPVCSYIFTGLG